MQTRGLRVENQEYFRYVDCEATVRELRMIGPDRRGGPIREERQSDGRIRRWAYIDAERNTCVILLDDGETGHNRFFDRDFKP